MELSNSFRSINSSADFDISQIPTVNVPTCPNIEVSEINENLLNVGFHRQKKKSLKSDNDRAVDYEDEIAAESFRAATRDDKLGDEVADFNANSNRYGNMGVTAVVNPNDNENNPSSYASTMQPSSLFLMVPDANGHRRSSYDDQAFRERQKILNRDYLKATDPDYYRRAGSVDHTCEYAETIT